MLKPDFHQDSTGLSDPYIKVTMGSQSVYTKVIKQTNNPKWNSMLVIPEINLYSNYDEIIENPPEIILELYDQDILSVKSSSYITTENFENR